MNWPEQRYWITVNGKLIKKVYPCFKFKIVNGEIILVFSMPGEPDIIMGDPDQWWR